MIKFFKLLKRRIDIYRAETQLKFILENQERYIRNLILKL